MPDSKCVCVCACVSHTGVACCERSLVQAVKDLGGGCATPEWGVNAQAAASPVTRCQLFATWDMGALGKPF